MAVKVVSFHKKKIIPKVRRLVHAYRNGYLGDTPMPEDTHPIFSSLEMKRIYYTLPMALNYQRNSYKMWESAKATYEDKDTSEVFRFDFVVDADIDVVRNKLTKHKLALQPNKHIDTWIRITKTIFDNWVSVTSLIDMNNRDYLILRDVLQKEYKKGFPYLSGPKIFNYWMFIMGEYGEVALKNRSFIEIAPDTHVIQASIRLGVITESEVEKMSREDISLRWRGILEGSGIEPIDVHPPLWFWSRSNFEYRIN